MWYIPSQGADIVKHNWTVQRGHYLIGCNEGTNAYTTQGKCMVFFKHNSRGTSHPHLTGIGLLSFKRFTHDCCSQNPGIWTTDTIFAKLHRIISRRTIRRIRRWRNSCIPRKEWPTILRLQKNFHQGHRKARTTRCRNRNISGWVVIYEADHHGIANAFHPKSDGNYDRYHLGFKNNCFLIGTTQITNLIITHAQGKVLGCTTSRIYQDTTQATLPRHMIRFETSIRENEPVRTRSQINDSGFTHFQRTAKQGQ